MNFGSSTSAHKPVIRHITSASTLASLSNHSSSSTMISLSKQDPHLMVSISQSGTGTSDLTPSGSGLTLRPGDVWSQVVLRVVPLFNGEGHKGFIEDLNEFVSQHIHKTIADSPSASLGKLHADLSELFSSGVQTLNHKLQPDQLSDDRLLVRLVEVWHFFFTGVLPYLEGIFLPLVTDSNLMSMIESKNNKVLQERLQQQHLLQQATSNAGLLSSSSSSILFRQTQRHQSRHCPTGSQASRPDETVQSIDIRRLALTAFRDQLVLPLFPRLYSLYARLYDPHQAGAPQRLSPDSHSEQMHAKRLQMVGLLCSVQTEDSKQASMEEFGKLIRLGKANDALLHPPPPHVRSGPSRSVSSVREAPEPTRPSPRPTEEDEERARAGQQQIRGWNKNRDFARRSIRRQLGRNGTRSGLAGEATTGPPGRAEEDAGQTRVAKAGRAEEQTQEQLRAGTRGGPTKMGSVSSTGSSMSTSMMMAVFRGSSSSKGAAPGGGEEAAAAAGGAEDGSVSSAGGNESWPGSVSVAGSGGSLTKHQASPQLAKQQSTREREQDQQQQAQHGGTRSSGPKNEPLPNSVGQVPQQAGGQVQQSPAQQQKLNLQIRPLQFHSPSHHQPHSQQQSHHHQQQQPHHHHHLKQHHHFKGTGIGVGVGCNKKTSATTGVVVVGTTGGGGGMTSDGNGEERRCEKSCEISTN